MSRVLILPGDGIGPEVTAEAVAVLKMVAPEVATESALIGGCAIDAEGAPLSDATVARAKACGLVLLGAVGGPKWDMRPPALRPERGLLRIRKELGLYANLRPAAVLPALADASPLKRSCVDGVDLVVVRENTEDLYSGLEHVVVPGVVESIKIITEKASTRIARFAFEYARRHHRKRVTAVHKANIMKLSDGLFLESARKIAKGFPEIPYDEKIVDNACMQLVMRPEQFDVIVLPNLYGDIVSDLCAGLVGGLGVVPGANLGLESAVFEAVHGTAPDIAGRDLANPLALIRSSIMMLYHMHKDVEAERIRAALRHVIVQRGIRTRDLGGEAGTTQFTDAVVEAIQ
jgi:isocitrate dehydrogenase (NAD+)